MYTEWKLKGTVLEGGRVEITIPELRVGDTVDVLIRAHGDPADIGAQPEPKSKRGKPTNEMPTYADDE